MKASELIEELQDLIRTHGDLDVEMEDGSDPSVEFLDDLEEDDDRDAIFLVE